MIYLCEQDKQEPDMVEAAFNTIAEVQRLRDAGFEQKQAEAITLSIHAGVTGGVATKADVEAVEKRLGDKLELVRTELDGKISTEIASAKFDLTWRLLAGIAAFNAIIFALMRYLPPPATG